MRRSVLPVWIVGIALLANAAAVAAPQPRKDPDKNDPELMEIRSYRLTMPKIEKYAAAAKELQGWEKAHPEFNKVAEEFTKGGDESSSDQTIDDAVKLVEKYPPAVAIIRKNGFTTREYILLSLAMLNDFMVVSMKKQGLVKQIPTDSITPENASLIEQNYDKINELMKAITPRDEEKGSPNDQ